MEAQFDFLIEIESVRIRNSKISPWKCYAVWIWVLILIQHFSLELPIVQGIHDCCRKLQFVFFFRTMEKYVHTHVAAKENEVISYHFPR